MFSINLYDEIDSILEPSNQTCRAKTVKPPTGRPISALASRCRGLTPPRICHAVHPLSQAQNTKMGAIPMLCARPAVSYRVDHSPLLVLPRRLRRSGAWSFARERCTWVPARLSQDQRRVSCRNSLILPIPSSPTESYAHSRCSIRFRLFCTARRWFAGRTGPKITSRRCICGSNPGVDSHLLSTSEFFQALYLFIYLLSIVSKLADPFSWACKSLCEHVSCRKSY
jgi:hypothetical protein